MLQKANNLTIDLTSNNKIFNCLSPQGSWLFHRFGRRDYPLLDLDVRKLFFYVQSNNISFINFYSIFGDTLAHSNFKEIFDFCNSKNIHMQINTSGFYDNIYNSDLTSYRVKLYGFTKTINIILPDVSIDILKDNLLKMNNVTIEYQCYEHNLIDLPELLDFCLENNIKLICLPGVSVHDNLNHVIDVNGNWLYDIFSVDNLDYMHQEIKDFKDAKNYFKTFQEKDLVQSVVGYHLIKIVNKRPGESILTAELFNYENTISNELEKFITVSGHIVKTFDQFIDVSCAIPGDWCATDFKLHNDYMSKIFANLSDFANNKVSL